MPQSVPSGAFWQPFSHRAPGCLKVSLLEPSGVHLATGAPNAVAVVVVDKYTGRDNLAD